MFRRLLAVVSWACMAMLGWAFLASPAAAQDPGYFTYVSLWAVPRSEWAAFEKQGKTLDATMQRLVADGTIVAWGDEETRVHQEDGYTHAEWFTATDRANLLKALEVVWAGATNAAFVAATKHHDLFLHTLLHGGKTASGETGYLRVIRWQAKPGQADALEALVMKDIKPRLDSDIENGTLIMYNFDVEDILVHPPGGYDLALLFPDGAAIDKFYADLVAARKDNPTVSQALGSLLVREETRSSLGRVTAYQHK